VGADDYRIKMWSIKSKTQPGGSIPIMGQWHKKQNGGIAYWVGQCKLFICLSNHRCPCYDAYLHSLSNLQQSTMTYVELSFSYVCFHFTRILGSVPTLTLKTFHNHSNTSLWKQTKENHSSHSRPFPSIDACS